MPTEIPASAILNTGLKKVNLLSPPSNKDKIVFSVNGIGIANQFGKSIVKSGATVSDERAINLRMQYDF